MMDMDDEMMEDDTSDDEMDEMSDDMSMDTSGMTIAEIVAGNDDFSTLLAAVTTAELAETLSEGEYTVFAPTDAAFANLLATVDLTASDLLASDLLTDVLLYHVVPGTVNAETVMTLDGESAETALTGNSIGIAITDDGGVVLNGVVNVTEADIMASNGVIHVIDEVLLPFAALEAFGLVADS